MSAPLRLDRSTIRRFAAPALGVAAYLVVAYLAYSPIPPLGGSRIVGCGCGDLAEQAWFLAWTPYALLHGHNLFFTTQLNYPSGVNLSSNTLMPVLGLLAAPFTRTIGPAGALMVMMRLSFALSATSMFLVLRRFTAWWPAAFIGGLLYGFSPYMLGQGYGHLNLLFVPFPPLMLALGYELLVRRRWAVRRTGLLIGLVAGLQYLVSSEVLATTALMVGIALVLLALRHRSEVRHAVVPLLSGMAWALLPFACLAGFPLYEVFAGPGHITGPPQPVDVLSSYHSDLLGPFVPTVSQRFAPAGWTALGDRFGMGDISENGSYLGIPLVVLLVGIGIWARREAVVRFAAVTGAAAFILSLGPRLVIGTHVTSIRLPYDVVTHLPLLADEVPGRYSLYLQLAVAVMLAIGLDRFWWGPAKRLRTGARAAVAAHLRSGPRATVRGPVIVVVLALALFPLVPRFPYATTSTGVPPYVTTGGLNHVPEGSVVLAYPYPQNPWNVAMLWQADARMRFSLLGDYAIIRQPDGDGSLSPPQLSPPAMQSLFSAALGDTPIPGSGQGTMTDAPPPEIPAVMAQLRTFLVRYRVGTILVDPVGYDPGLVDAYLTEALGARTVDVGGMEVWYRVQQDLRNSGSTRAPAGRVG